MHNKIRTIDTIVKLFMYTYLSYSIVAIHKRPILVSDYEYQIRYQTSVGIIHLKLKTNNFTSIKIVIINV